MLPVLITILQLNWRKTFILYWHCTDDRTISTIYKFNSSIITLLNLEKGNEVSSSLG